MRLSIVCLLVVATVYCQFSSCESFDVHKTLTKVKEALEKGIGGKVKQFFNGVLKFFKERTGKFTIDGTPLVMTFFADDCEMDIGGRKRDLFEVKCPADVTEIITGTKRHCIKSDQETAVQCATRLVLEEIQKNIEIGKISDKSTH